MQLLADSGDAAPLIFGGLSLGFFLLILAAVVVSMIFWIWMLIDCLGNDSLQGSERIIWALVIFFTHFLGAILYFALVRSKRASAAPRIQS